MLTVELKVNLLAPASGDRVVAEGEVVRAGRTLTVCHGDAYAEQDDERVHVATMLATMVRRRADDLAGGRVAGRLPCRRSSVRVRSSALRRPSNAHGPSSAQRTGIVRGGVAARA